LVNERVTETVDANGNVTQRTIERGIDDHATAQPTVVAVERRSGGGGVLAAVVLLALIAVAAWLFLGGGLSENRKDDAVAEAARDVGAAVEKTGDSIEKAVDKAVK
jgi:hypothetical protein